MGTVGNLNPTLADFAKRQDPNGKIDTMVEILGQTNEILEDMTFQEGNLETGHKLYVAKQGKEVKRVDTTLPILGQDGTYPISKPNGKIECHVIADLETVTAVLSQLADTSVGKIRPAKRAPKVEAEAVEAAPVAE